MAATMWNVLGKCRSNLQMTPNCICRLYNVKRKGGVIKDKMHSVQLFLQDYPGFDYKIKPEGRHPGENITLKELLQKLNVKDLDISRPIDIGLPVSAPMSRKIAREREQFIKQLKSDPDLEKSARMRTLEVPLIEVKTEWERTDGSQQIKKVAEHYGIFQDLFDGAHFYPRVPLRIEYPCNEEYITPVYRGNHIKPSEAAVAPKVSFASDPDSLWTLILTNPDGHLQDSSSEYLHWFIGNIKGSDVEKGEVVCDYLQPFPPRGTGYHRLIFVLYKQNEYIDYSSVRLATPCMSLKERTFKTFDFYSERQHLLTPAGIAFFQSEWDESVRTIFHHKLVMREPVFEYDFPAPRIRKQQVFPNKQPFNIYLEKYRDPQDVGKEVLIERLKTVHPFQPEPPKLKYPNTVPVPLNTPAWLRTERFKRAMRIGKYRGLDVEVFKPERPSRPVLGIKERDDGSLTPF